MAVLWTKADKGARLACGLRLARRSDWVGDRSWLGDHGRSLVMNAGAWY